MAEPEHLEFRTDDRAAVVARMRGLARDRDGWLNVEPVLDPDDVPPSGSALFSVFSGRGPDVPLATWVPGEDHGKRVEPTCVGIEHGSGPKAAERLAAAGVAVPEGWRVLQDHRKRGLVVAIPDDADPDAVLDWLLRATATLTALPVTGTWRAGFFLRRRARSS